MHPIEFLFYIVIFFILIFILMWLGNRPTPSRYQELVKLLDIEQNKLKILQEDYKKRKSQVGFFKKLTVDNSKLLSHQEKLRKLTEEYQKHAIKFSPYERKKNQDKIDKTNALEEKLTGVVQFGLTTKSIFDVVTKLIK